MGIIRYGKIIGTIRKQNIALEILIEGHADDTYSFIPDKVWYLEESLINAGVLGKVYKFKKEKRKVPTLEERQKIKKWYKFW